ncbi:MAG: alpha/beta fold hydrolase [Candidatus Puniceispirillaceae bacterium]
MPSTLQSDPRYCDAILGGEDIVTGSVRGHLWLCEASRNGISGAPKFLILPGFTEFCEKYAHVARKMVHLGYDCLIIDWPGQGRSGHLGTTPLMVHCDRFTGHITALKQLIKAAGWHTSNLHIIGHSMGGHLALLACGALKSQIATVALSAPMILPRPRPSWAIRLLGVILGMAGRDRHYTPFTQIPSVDSLQIFDERNMLTTDEAGYLWQTKWFFDYPLLRRYGASVGWVREAYRSAARYVANPAYLSGLDVPVLILKAEKEQIVSNAKISFAASHLPQADLVTIKGAKHELFNETPAIDDQIWDHLTRFWDRQGL